MNRTLLALIIAGTTVLIALLDFATSAELIGSMLFTFPLALCVLQRSKWLLWATTVIATLLTAGAGIWSFHRVQLLNPWVASANRGLLTPDSEHFYFVHSYVVAPTDPAVVAATTDYGAPFVSAVAQGNVFACQFHPEKSQRAGIALLGRFVAS